METEQVIDKCNSEQVLDDNYANDTCVPSQQHRDINARQDSCSLVLNQETTKQIVSRMNTEMCDTSTADGATGQIDIIKGSSISNLSHLTQ